MPAGADDAQERVKKFSEREKRNYFPRNSGEFYSLKLTLEDHNVTAEFV